MGTGVMDRLTNAFRWLETRLDEGGWVRRAYLLAATVMTWRVTEWAMGYVTTSKLPGLEQAAVIAAVTAPSAAVAKFAFDAYLDSRKKSLELTS